MRLGSWGRIRSRTSRSAHFQRDRLGVEFAVRQQAVDGAFEIAAVVGDGAGEIIQHRCRDVEARMMRARRGPPAT